MMMTRLTGKIASQIARPFAGALLTAALLASPFAANPAAAADLGEGRPVRPPSDFAPPVQMNDIGPWSGFYLGATAGYGFGQGRADGDNGRVAFDQSGALGTVFAGYNWQMGRAVLGVEADIGTGNLKSSTSGTLGVLNTDLNSMGSFRGRAGLLVTPALLLYGTAGLGWASYDVGLTGFPSETKTFTGLQVGAGLEYMISRNVTLRTEYIFSDYGREVLSNTAGANGYKPDSHAIRAGVAIKF